MSFFGFNTALPTDRERAGDGPGFFSPPDPFAGISRPAGNPEDGDDFEDSEENALEFEDTYDGLGGRLDDTDDVFNEDTFGDDATGPVAQVSVGKDFDFFGQTAQVATAIDEEHMRYTRQAVQPKAPRTDMGAVLKAPGKPARTGYEKYNDEGAISGLEVNASLWGVGTKAPAKGGGMPHPEQKIEDGSKATSAKKMMSLEEVEASMMVKSKKRASAQEQPAPGSLAPPAGGSQPGLVQEYPPPTASTSRSARPPPHDTAQQPLHRQGQYPPMPTQILAAPTQRDLPVSYGGEPRHYGEVGQAPAHQPRQTLQNPNRNAPQMQPFPPSAMRDSRLPPLHGPMVSGGSVSRAPPMPLPQQLMNMSEEQRMAIGMEEARRAKRNYKIYLLSRDNGLMTPQDKNFVTRIQLQQLVSATGNPNEQEADAALDEDFYFHVHSHIRRGPRAEPQQPLNALAQTYLFQTGTRHGGVVGRRQKRGGDMHVQRMEQQVQRAVEAAKLKPKNNQLVIQGSLGKISFSNVKTPRQMLNIKRSDSNQDANRPPGVGRAGSERRSQSYVAGKGDRRGTLRQIENVYSALMRMEDQERRMPEADDAAVEVAAEQQAAWAHEMKVLKQKLWVELKVMEPIVANSPVPHPFIAFLSFAKGKRVIPRIFRQMDQEQRVTILTMIVVHIGVLDVVRHAQLRPDEPQLPSAVREEVELFSQAVMPSLFGYVNEVPLNIIIGLLGILLDSADVQSVARSKIGLSILTMFLSRAELVRQTGSVEDSDWGQWTSVYGRLFNALEPVLGTIFPASVNSGEDTYVWQFLAAIGLGASPEQQQRLVMAVKDRVMETVSVSKALPPEMSSQRLGNVNLFMRAIGLDVELLG